MANEPRIVVDTGVIVSALLLPRSTPRQAFDRAASVGRLLLSSRTLAELDEVLRRPKFDPYLTEDERLDFLAALVREAELVDVNAVVTDCRDPKDNKFLELAISGRATHLVTGDADLLALHPFRGIEVLNPTMFLAVLIERRLSATCRVCGETIYRGFARCQNPGCLAVREEFRGYEAIIVATPTACLLSGAPTDIQLPNGDAFWAPYFLDMVEAGWIDRDLRYTALFHERFPDWGAWRR